MKENETSKGNSQKGELAAEEKFVQVGVFALRDPKGNFLPSVPLFIRAEDAGGVNEQTGLTVGEELASMDVAKVLADKHKQYVQGTRKAAAARKKNGNSN